MTDNLYRVRENIHAPAASCRVGIDAQCALMDVMRNEPALMMGRTAIFIALPKSVHKSQGGDLARRAEKSRAWKPATHRSRAAYRFTGTSRSARKMRATVKGLSWAMDT
jgi:hypothetical protein